MIVKHSFRVKSIGEFDSLSFLTGIHKSGTKISLEIRIENRVDVLLSVIEKSLFNKEKEARIKERIVKEFFRGCELGEMESYPLTGEACVLVHILGTPAPGEEQLTRIVNKILETGIKSRFFLTLKPFSISGLDSPFSANFSLAVYGHNRGEAKRNAQLIVPLIYSVYGGGGSSIKTVFENRGAIRTIQKITDGKQTYSTFLDCEHASLYFQIPYTYGVEQPKKMDFPMPDKPFTGIELGTLSDFNVQEIKTVKLDPTRIFEHIAVWGASGTGKTTFLKNLLLKLEKENIKFCIFDWHNEYREIASRTDGRIGDDILIFNPLLAPFQINPLEIPDLKDEEKEILVWERIENFVSLIRHLFVLGEIQESTIRRNLYALYNSGTEATIGSLVDSIGGKKTEALSSKLEKFTSGIYGGIFNSLKSSMKISEIRKKNIIFELGDIPIEVRKFFVGTFLIMWWDSLRIDELTPHVLVLDDFQEYASFAVIKKMLSEARKYKQGLILSHQGPYQLSKEMSEEVARNAGTKIIFRLEQTWDKYIVRDALGSLTKEDLQALSYLDRGETIVKIPQLRFPVRMNTPLPLEFEKTSDSQVREMMGKKPFVASTQKIESNRVLTEMEMKFLSQVHKDQGASLTEITKNLGIKTSRGYALKRKMGELGYLEEEKIRSGIGRPKKIIKLSDKALRTLNIEKKETPVHYGKEEHLFIKNKIAEILDGWIVKIEDGCDVKVEGNGKKFAIEVETGKSKDKKQLLHNIERNLGWADKTIIVCPNKSSRQKIEQILDKENKEKLAILTYQQLGNLEDFLRDA